MRLGDLVLVAAVAAASLALGTCAGAPAQMAKGAGADGTGAQAPPGEPAVAADAESAPAPASAVSASTAKAAEPPSPAPQAGAPAPVVAAVTDAAFGPAESRQEEAAAKPEQALAGQRSAAAEPAVRYLSADDSNSQASPVVVRKLIRSGRYVQPSVVRTYEFLNYFRFDYPAPEQGDIAIYAEMAPSREQGQYTLQVALRSRDSDREQLPPLRLTILLDVSGSMAGEPLEVAKRFVLGVAERLRPGDLLSIVACARDARVVVEGHEVAASTVAFLSDTVLPSLAANDVTDLERGIRLAYEVANRRYAARALNRVILLSDGAANAGDTAVESIARYAEDSDRQGIYLAGVGVGEGFNDSLMDRFTDAGRGAYLFLDGAHEVDHALSGAAFVSNFDLALKDVRLRMVIPAGWEIVEFHGEQISAVASEVVPQYLAPGDQMIYHLEIKGPGTPQDTFGFEAEYRPLGGKPARASASLSVIDMLRAQRGIAKGNAVVAYAEMLKEIAFPLEPNRAANLEALSEARESVAAAEKRLDDVELREVLALLDAYGLTLSEGERFALSRDRASTDPAAVLGIPPEAVRKVGVSGPAPQLAVASLERLRSSTRLVPQEGYRFLALSSGPVGNPQPAGSGQLAERSYPNPVPEFMGAAKAAPDRRAVFDLHQVTLDLVAPPEARSFSFDFDFFSAEYPDYVGQEYNDTFYAILRSPSTNGGRSTNIAFDANGASMEVDNNYFQQPFHPVPNAGTGFDAHGSTGWLRTSWPILGGERFTLILSVHDEGDAVFDSLVVVDNFRFHEYPAVGTTDPIN